MNKHLKKLRLSIARRLMGASEGFIPIDENGGWQVRQRPTASLQRTAELFNQVGGKTIVEIGTGIHGKMAGNSMLVWTGKTNAQRIVAIDLEQRRLDEVNQATQGYNNVETVLADGIEYVRTFDGTIDLLYLDFWTPDPEGALEGTGRAEAYKAAFLAAQDKLSEHALILIDDTDHIHPWKHTYIVPIAREAGFQVLHIGRQTLMKR